MIIWHWVPFREIQRFFVTLSFSRVTPSSFVFGLWVSSWNDIWCSPYERDPHQMRFLIAWQAEPAPSPMWRPKKSCLRSNTEPENRFNKMMFLLEKSPIKLARKAYLSDVLQHPVMPKPLSGYPKTLWLRRTPFSGGYWRTKHRNRKNLNSVRMYWRRQKSYLAPVREEKYQNNLYP